MIYSIIHTRTLPYRRLAMAGPDGARRSPWRRPSDIYKVLKMVVTAADEMTGS